MGRQRICYTTEFKQESGCLVLEQGFTINIKTYEASGYSLGWCYFSLHYSLYITLPFG